MGRLHGDAKLQPQKSNKVVVQPSGRISSREAREMLRLTQARLSENESYLRMCKEIKKETGHEVSTLERR